MNKFGKQMFGIALVAVAVAAGPVFAMNHMQHGSGAMDHSKMGGMKGDASESMPSIDGEVRRVDKAAGKVTLRHGEIRQLEMPPMTMVFEVKDKALLDTVKAGDKVHFKVINENGKMIVTEMKPAS